MCPLQSNEPHVGGVLPSRDSPIRQRAPKAGVRGDPLGDGLLRGSKAPAVSGGVPQRGSSSGGAHGMPPGSAPVRSAIATGSSSYATTGRHRLPTPAGSDSQMLLKQLKVRSPQSSSLDGVFGICKRNQRRSTPSHLRSSLGVWAPDRSRRQPRMGTNSVFSSASTASRKCPRPVFSMVIGA